MGLFLVLLVAKLLDIAAIASFFIGLFKVRNAVGYPLALALDILGHLVLRSTQVTTVTWDAFDAIDIAAGLIAASLAFFIGKAIRRDIRS
jgi:hypothetical protein